MEKDRGQGTVQLAHVFLVSVIKLEKLMVKSCVGNGEKVVAELC